jgi:hypothetical protein
MSDPEPGGTQLAVLLLAMVRRVWILIGLSGCLMPPPIDEGDPVDNHPPRIAPESLLPTPPSEDMSVLCPPYDFRATVTDPDSRDTLYWRVFIDYDLEDELEKVENEPGELPPASTSSRLIAFKVDPKDVLFRATFGRSRFDVPHSVELVVVDRPFVDTLEPYGRFVDEPGETDSYSWTIELLEEADPDPCVGGGT